MADKLPSYLYGIYKKSKDDTQYCTAWLINTARQVGHDISPYIKQPGNKSSLPPATVPNDRPTKQPSILVRVSDLLLLASAVAVRRPGISIEDDFMRSLKQTLQAREVFAAWFADSVNSDVQDSNQRHLFFIHVLDSGLELFDPLHCQQSAEQPVMPPRSTDLPSHHSGLISKTSEQSLEQITDEVEDLGLGSSSSSSPLDHSDQPPVTEDLPISSVTDDLDNVVLDESEANPKDWDRFFVLHRFLVDLHRIRAFVRQAWHRYKLGECDLVTVISLTNIAIDIAINLEKEVGMSIEDQMPTLCKYNIVIIKFVLNKMRNSTEAPSKYDIGDSDETDMVPTDIPDFVFLREYAAALDLLRPWLATANKITTSAVNHREAKLARKKDLSDADEADAPPKSSAEAAQLDTPSGCVENRIGAAHWLWENYMEGTIPDAETSGDFVDPDLFQFPGTYSKILHAAFDDSLGWHYERSSSSNANTVVDLVLERVKDMCMNFCPRLSTAFAVRLFFDAHETLGEEHRNRPLAELDAAAGRCRMKAQLQLASLKKAGIDEDSHFEDKFVPGHPSSAPRLVVRISTQILDSICEQSESAWFLTQKNFRTRLMHNPTACGLHALYLEQLQSASAITLADRWMVLMPLAHFYNAAKVSGKLSLPWPDMEFLIDIHGPEWLFLGGRPDTISGCLAKYHALLAGTSGSLAYSRSSSSKPQYYYRRQLWPRFCPLSRYLSGRFGFMGKLKEQRVNFNRDTKG